MSANIKDLDKPQNLCFALIFYQCIKNIIKTCLIMPETYDSCKQIRIKVRIGIKGETLRLQTYLLQENVAETIWITISLYINYMASRTPIPEYISFGDRKAQQCYVVRFSRFPQREMVRKNAFKFKSTNYSLSEQFSKGNTRQTQNLDARVYQSKRGREKDGTCQG